MAYLNEKICYKCRIIKKIKDFAVVEDGYKYICKKCFINGENAICVKDG